MDIDANKLLLLALAFVPNTSFATQASLKKEQVEKTVASAKKDLSAANLIVLVDSGGESVFNENKFLVQQFNAALDYGSCPIIMSGNIINNWLVQAKKFEAFKAKGMSDAQKALFEKAQKISAEAVVFNPFVYFSFDVFRNKIGRKIKQLEGITKLYRDYASFTSDLSALFAKGDDLSNPLLYSGVDCFMRQSLLRGYYIFHCKDTQEYLLIPKTLNQKLVAERFEIQNKAILEPVSLAELPSKLNSWNPTLENVSYWRGGFMGPGIDFFRRKSWDLWGQVSWNNLKKIFVPQSDEWIMYWGGHGWYTPPSIQKGEMGSLLKVEYFKDLHNFIPYAHIGALTVLQHLDFLEFAGKTIKTRAVIEDTCFGSGFHAQLTALQLRALATESKQFTPFTYIKFGLTNVSTEGPEAPHEADYSVFFEKMREGTDESIKEGLAAIFCQPRISNACVLSTPMILKRGTTNFELLDIDRVLYEIKTSKDAVCSIDPAKIRGILLYPKRPVGPIKISIKEELDQGVTSPVLVVMGSAYETSSFIDRVDLAYSVERFLVQSIFSFTEIARRTFVIKDLLGLNYENSGLKPSHNEKNIALEKVIIEKGYTTDYYGISGTIKVAGTVLCKIKGENKYYKATIIKSFEDDDQEPELSKFELVSKDTIEKRPEIFAMEL